MKKLPVFLTLLFALLVYGQNSIGFEGFHFHSIPNDQSITLKYDGLSIIYDGSRGKKISTEAGIGIGIIESSSDPEFLEGFPVAIKVFYGTVFDTELISSIGFRSSSRTGFVWLAFSKWAWTLSVGPKIYIRFNNADVFLGTEMEVKTFSTGELMGFWSFNFGVNYTFTGVVE
ncbi:hypothetical protein AT15_04890 [Kosmotoga arenicorallina S304]|uniref:Outer membrane protein beta-barrel domain-containing protein n=1 Tax=Kosmotoga arenicorallina S304 TaxID=1453497 RepID=A0A176JWG6_9BACT|nr:hypothetical protein [Kosmotoga arenicorallina]OAA28023.1 hypothetical protein AT15_04890 [Kosmotoga arenicorallina S304]